MNKPTMIDHRPMARRTSSLIAALVVVFVLALSLTNGASAQQNAPNPKPGVNASATTSEQAPAAQTRPAISNEQALYLVRSTLLTLNDANRSGNYTVLRDLAGPLRLNLQKPLLVRDLGAQRWVALLRGSQR